MRRAGATYEEIAKAGGGIASTVARTAAASDEELLEQSRRRLHALMQGGCTTVEVKTGYGLDPESEMRLLRIANQLGNGEAVRIVPTLLALHALPPDQRDHRAQYVGEIVDKLIPEAAKSGLATSVDAFCDTIAFTPEETERLFKAAAHHGLTRPPPRRAAFEPARRRACCQISRAVGGSSRTSRRSGREGDGGRRNGRRAPARRFLRAPGRAETSGRAAAQAQGADGDRD